VEFQPCFVDFVDVEVPGSDVEVPKVPDPAGTLCEIRRTVSWLTARKSAIYFSATPSRQAVRIKQRRNTLASCDRHRPHINSFFASTSAQSKPSTPSKRTVPDRNASSGSELPAASASDRLETPALYASSTVSFTASESIPCRIRRSLRSAITCGLHTSKRGNGFCSMRERFMAGSGPSMKVRYASNAASLDDFGFGSGKISAPCERL